MKIAAQFLFLCFSCCAQPYPVTTQGGAPASASASASAVVPQEMLSHWRQATVALGVVIKDGNNAKFVTTGSAVIVALDSRHGCLLTAKHMVVNLDTGAVTPNLWVRFASLSGGEENPIPLTLFDQQGRNVWKTSSDGGDLAVIPLPQEAWSRKRVEAVSIADFADPKNDVFQGANVIVLGYPQIIGEAFLSSPIARGGIIAWVNPKDPGGEPFLVDANLYNGNSGGPVFRVRNGLDRFGNVNLGGGLALLGIVSKGPLQNAPVISADGYVYHENAATGGKHKEVAVVANVGGIGIIEPASRARKLIEEAFANPPSH